MKILNNEQVREADAYTIENEPIASIDLMERAAGQLYRQYISQFSIHQKVVIFAGPGNNGGDGIALARLLNNKGYHVSLFIMKTGRGLSADSQVNYDRLPENDLLNVDWIDDKSDFPEPEDDSIILDALFGSGLARPLDGFAAKLVNHINSLSNTTVAVDIPSGLFAEDTSDNAKQAIVKADHTWCFQFPKIAFMMPENQEYVGDWKYFDIGLMKEFTETVNTSYNYITKELVGGLLKSRHRFDHKGTFGHGVLFAGSYEKAGAAILGAKACLRSGIGLLTVHIPENIIGPLQTAVPEAMASISDDFFTISSLPDISPYSAIGAGPGIGTNKKTVKVAEGILKSGLPLVLDADALNILSEHQDLLKSLSPGTILTPHPGEYKRLFGDDRDHYSRLRRMMKISVERKIIIVLKGANTAITLPDGRLFFNSTGNPGMATAGSGDVLTGIILSLLAQGYEAADAAIVSVYLHGLAGDLAMIEKSLEGLIAGDIIEKLPAAFKSCRAV